MSVTFRVSSCPSDQLSLLNRAIISPNVFKPEIRHIEIVNSSRCRFVFTLERFQSFNPGEMGFSLPMRKWAELALNANIEARPYTFDIKSQLVSAIILEVDFMIKNTITNEDYDTEEMAKEFSQQFADQSFTVGQVLAFKHSNKKLLKITVKEMQVLDVSFVRGDAPKQNEKRTTTIGLVSANSEVKFVEASDSAVKLKGKAKGNSPVTSIISPDWDFQSMGIGGLDKEFNDIFRRAFATRIIPPEHIEEEGCTHVRGILLYGPPGTGKTLIARQIGKMLNARPPKIVNGPSILDKYVGESEANIRRLFEDAETEFKKLGNRSGLHLIIFDEIDAICKARGSVAGASGVHDTVVNQLLTIMDGVETLGNILVIGMTNRIDMIDEALLRPGRFEIKIEIGLPDQMGRLDIFKIHTAKMRNNGRLAPDVDLQRLAAMTKNFSGAEIEGLVRAAQSCSINRIVKASNKVEIDYEASKSRQITMADFLYAIEHDVKPSLGTSADIIEKLYGRDIINWCSEIPQILNESQILIEAARSSGPNVITILLEGLPNSGKSALAGKIAMNSEFPFIKMISPANVKGFTETSKSQYIQKVFDDAYKSEQSCILLDEIEYLIDYHPVGPRFSNIVCLTLRSLLKQEPPKTRSILIICTTAEMAVLKEFRMLPFFQKIIHIPMMTEPQHIMAVIYYLKDASKGCPILMERDVAFIQQALNKMDRISIGIKKFLKIINELKALNQDTRAVRLIQRLEEEQHNHDYFR